MLERVSGGSEQGSYSSNILATFWRQPRRRAAIMEKLKKEAKKAANKGGKGDKKKGSAGPEKKAKDAAKRILK